MSLPGFSSVVGSRALLPTTSSTPLTLTTSYSSKLKKETNGEGFLDKDVNYKKVFQCSSVPLYVLDVKDNYRLIAANDAFLRQVKVPLEALIGRYFFEEYPDQFHHGQLYPQGLIFRRSVEKAIETKSTIVCPDLFVYDIPVSYGSDTIVRKYWNVVFTPIQENNGEIRHILVKSIDMTDTVMAKMAAPGEKLTAEELVQRVIQTNIELTQKSRSLHAAYEKLDNINNQLQLAMEAVKASSKAKAEFLANISHEMRTPLNAIIGFSELLETDQAITGENEEFVRYISEAGNHLLGLINDLLDVAKIDSGRLCLNPQVMNIYDLISNVTGMFAPKCVEKGLETQVLISPDVPKFIVGDCLRLRQMIMNVVSNAVKFSDRGRICLEVSQSPVSRDLMTLNIRVSDNGVGISESDIKNLFQRFEQVGKVRISDGTGLGLAITKELARLMGGDIEVSSELGVGSTFTFRVQVGVAREGARKANGQPLAHVLPKYSSTPILIVDDVELNRRILKLSLEKMGFVNIKEASDGIEALELMQQSSFALVLMDIFMPRMGGIEATRFIREDPKQKAVKVFAITASELSPEKILALNTIFDSTLSKPLRFTELQTQMEAHCAIKFSSLPPSSKMRRLLLVDDQLPLRKLIAKTLEGCGFDLDQASSGPEAIEKIKSAPPYDVILMDRVMPGIDGFEAAEIIATQLDLKTVPIILIMSSDFDDWHREQKSRGVVSGIIEKPVKIKDFISIVSTLLTRNGSQ